MTDIFPPDFNAVIGIQEKMTGPGAGSAPFMASDWLPSFLFVGIGICALAILWRRRSLVSAADKALMLGCTASLMIIAGPWVQGDTAPRFQLIAVIPATVLVLFLLLHLEGR